MKLTFFAIACVLCAACGSKKLNREKATALITQSLKLPFTESRAINSGTFRDDAEFGMSSCSLPDVFEGEQMLVRDGYRTFSSNSQDAGFSQTYCIYTYEFTDLAKQYIISIKRFSHTAEELMKVSEVQFGELQTLREVNKDEYEVEFNLKRIINPIGLAFNKGVWADRSQRLNDNDYTNLKVKILRYDKGWQIATDDLSKIQNQLNGRSVNQ